MKNELLLLYIKHQSNNVMIGIMVPLDLNESDGVKPSLFQILKGLRLDDEFYMECGN